MDGKAALFFAVVFMILCALAYSDRESERESCEVDTAAFFKQPAKYINGHCQVFGYGRVDGKGK